MSGAWVDAHGTGFTCSTARLLRPAQGSYVEAAAGRAVRHSFAAPRAQSDPTGARRAFAAGGGGHWWTPGRPAFSDTVFPPPALNLTNPAPADLREVRQSC